MCDFEDIYVTSMLRIIRTIYVKNNTQSYILDEDVANLRLELGVERRAAKTKLVVVCLHKLKQQQSGRFPDESPK